MHSHVEWYATDCDGPLSGSYVMEMTDEERASDMGDLHFQDRVLTNVVRVTARRGTLTVEETDDGTPAFSWAETTDEGRRNVEAVFYQDNESCGGDHAATRRDHTAEAAGY